ncbi:MAG: prepilin-type N-terminal cleavage/methylation domain-containing protein [bacterium]|nr:prepilin-type N-terminal cleavage/methylation domain-containing protein [bacterium]
MKEEHKSIQGVTLIELLVTLAILGLILGGLYSMLDSANRAYRDNRALVVRQQTSRNVLNYMLFRLREIDGSGLVKDPRYCEDCHTPQIDGDSGTDSAVIPCVADVRIPRRSLFIEELTTTTLPTLSDVPAEYQNLSGFNSIEFWADLLPIVGLPDEFTDSPSTAAADTTYSSARNGAYDLTIDENGNGTFDPSEDAEILYYDQNDDGDYDYFAEKWTLALKEAQDGKTMQLVESLSFTHTTDKGGVIDVSGKNKSTYAPYTSQAVATGVVGLGIVPIPRIAPANYPVPVDTKLRHLSCGRGNPRSRDIDVCHGVDASEPWLNVYQNETAFSYSQFMDTHEWWNIKALAIELTTTEPTLRKFTRIKHILVPRNLEVNLEYYSPSP